MRYNNKVEFENVAVTVGDKSTKCTSIYNALFLTLLVIFKFVKSMHLLINSLSIKILCFSSMQFSRL